MWSIDLALLPPSPYFLFPCLWNGMCIFAEDFVCWADYVPIMHCELPRGWMVPPACQFSVQPALCHRVLLISTFFPPPLRPSREVVLVTSLMVNNSYWWVQACCLLTMSTNSYGPAKWLGKCFLHLHPGGRELMRWMIDKLEMLIHQIYINKTHPLPNSEPLSSPKPLLYGH